MTTRKILAAAVFVVIAGLPLSVQAQNDYWSGTEDINSDIGRNGNVGIGTTSPGTRIANPVRHTRTK